jgi:hypothetical protein
VWFPCDTIVYAFVYTTTGPQYSTIEQILHSLAISLYVPAFERNLAHLRHDFHIDVKTRKSDDAYRLGTFKAFVGQTTISVTRHSCTRTGSVEPPATTARSVCEPSAL